MPIHSLVNVPHFLTSTTFALSVLDTEIKNVLESEGIVFIPWLSDSHVM